MQHLRSAGRKVTSLSLSLKIRCAAFFWVLLLAEAGAACCLRVAVGVAGTHLPNPVDKEAVDGRWRRAPRVWGRGRRRRWRRSSPRLPAHVIVVRPAAAVTCLQPTRPPRLMLDGEELAFRVRLALAAAVLRAGRRRGLNVRARKVHPDLQRAIILRPTTGHLRRIRPGSVRDVNHLNRATVIRRPSACHRESPAQGDHLVPESLVGRLQGPTATGWG